MDDYGDVLSMVHEPNDSIGIHNKETMDTIEANIMEALADQITEAEVEELATLTWERLKTAVLEYRGPGGMVENLRILWKL